MGVYWVCGYTGSPRLTRFHFTRSSPYARFTNIPKYFTLRVFDPYSSPYAEIWRFFRKNSRKFRKSFNFFCNFSKKWLKKSIKTEIRGLRWNSRIMRYEIEILMGKFTFPRFTRISLYADFRKNRKPRKARTTCIQYYIYLTILTIRVFRFQLLLA